MTNLTKRQVAMLLEALEKNGFLRHANRGRGSAAIASSLQKLGLATVEEVRVIDLIFRLELRLTDEGFKAAKKAKSK